MTAPARGLTSLQRPDHRFRYYDLWVIVFVVVLLVSNLVGPKIVAVGAFRISGAQLLFPITYIFGDIFTEVYGYAGSRRAIWLGFFGSALMALMGLIVVALPAAPDFKDQAAFATVFGFVPRMVGASLAAYWAGEFANSYVMAKMKVLTQGRALWVRTISSTAVGQLVDSIVVMTLAFAGKESWATIGNLIFTGYFGKVAYEALMTPATYIAVNSLKRAEGVDVYDVDTNFSPFASGTEGEKFIPVGPAQPETGIVRQPS
ncbi:MAG: queuosine precursor transporter [Bryobacteraceae bacterium]|nr:queuosine precursor transporter [Bryobacteraceae bacterium]